MKKSILLLSITLMLFTACTQNPKEQSTASENTQTSDSTENNNAATAESKTAAMYPALSQYIDVVVKDFAAIPQDRKDQLKKIALFVQTKTSSGEPANITFICTHNSRRSHISQIWAATAAAYYNLNGINTYSGGTEATAFNPRAVATLERAGFKIQNPGGENPHYQVSFGENSLSMECFSKKYDDATNANENFVAVMTCSQADKNCPNIPGASLRIPIPFEDPKVSDGKPNEAATYDERCKQIATEMFYLMSQVKI